MVAAGFNRGRERRSAIH